MIFTESTSDYSKLNDRLIAILEGTSTSDVSSPIYSEGSVSSKKSGVRFNEMVERIEVLTEDENVKSNDIQAGSEDSHL